MNPLKVSIFLCRGIQKELGKKVIVSLMHNPWGSGGSVTEVLAAQAGGQKFNLRNSYEKKVRHGGMHL